MTDVMKIAANDLHFLEQRLQLLAQLAGNGDADNESEDDASRDMANHGIRLTRGVLTTMFLDVGEEIGRIRQTLAVGGGE